MRLHEFILIYIYKQHFRKTIMNVGQLENKRSVHSCEAHTFQMTTNSIQIFSKEQSKQSNYQGFGLLSIFVRSIGKIQYKTFNWSLNFSPLFISQFYKIGKISVKRGWHNFGKLDITDEKVWMQDIGGNKDGGGGIQGI